MLEICESGSKATAWELTRKTLSPEFFSNHSLDAFEKWRAETSGANAMMKQVSIIAIAMALIAASSAAMAEPKKTACI